MSLAFIAGAKYTVLVTYSQYLLLGLFQGCFIGCGQGFSSSQLFCQLFYFCFRCSDILQKLGGLRENTFQQHLVFCDDFTAKQLNTLIHPEKDSELNVTANYFYLNTYLHIHGKFQNIHHRCHLTYSNKNR